MGWVTLSVTLLHFTDVDIMKISKGVFIYSESWKEPVLEISLIELAKSHVINNVLKDFVICDICSEPIHIMITEETKETVIAVISDLYAEKRGFSIIEGKLRLSYICYESRNLHS